MVFDTTRGILQVGRSTGWADYQPLPLNLAVPTDSTTAVSLAHSAAGGKGLSFTSGGVVSFSADLNALAGVVTVLAATPGLGIKSSGNKQVLLTTSSTALVSDSPVSMPSITLTGSDTVITAPAKTIAVGTVNADSAAITTLNVGGTITAGVINASGGTINGVTFPGNWIGAPSGFVSSAGYFSGNSGAAVMSFRDPTSGAVGSAAVVTTTDVVTLQGAFTNVHNQMQILDGRNISWYNAAVTLSAPIAPNVVSGSDPGAANYPDGTLWIS